MGYRYARLAVSACRTFTDTPDLDSHNTSHLLIGHRYTHNSTSILLYRPFLPPPSSSPYNGADAIAIPKCRLLDTTGGYIVQAMVRVEEGSNVETMTQGTDELIALKETLKGAIELEIGDRLALDTRMR